MQKLGLSVGEYRENQDVCCTVLRILKHRNISLFEDTIEQTGLQGYEKTERTKTKQEQDIYRVKQRASGRAQLVSQRGKSMVVMMKCVQFLREAEAKRYTNLTSPA